MYIGIELNYAYKRETHTYIRKQTPWIVVTVKMLINNAVKYTATTLIK